jgi:hypothetical protein
MLTACSCTCQPAAADAYNCTRLYGERSVSVELRHRAEPYIFKFDCVLPETTTQEEVFEREQPPQHNTAQRQKCSGFVLFATLCYQAVILANA